MIDSKLWQHQARELGGEELVATIEGMARDINDIKKSMANLASSAFPGGDIEGHRRYHDLVIKRTEEIRQLRIAIQTKTISGLVWAFLIFLGLCIFNYVIGIRPPTFPPTPMP